MTINYVDFVDDAMHCGKGAPHKSESVASKDVTDFGRVEIQPTRYSKAQVLALPQYRKQQEILLNVLDGDKDYTVYDVEKLIVAYMESKTARKTPQIVDDDFFKICD